MPEALYKRPGYCLTLLNQLSANVTHVEFHPAGSEGAGGFFVIYVSVNKDSLPLKGTLQKKVSGFPSPAGMSLTKLSLVGNN